MSSYYVTCPTGNLKIFLCYDFSLPFLTFSIIKCVLEKWKHLTLYIMEITSSKILVVSKDILYFFHSIFHTFLSSLKLIIIAFHLAFFFFWSLGYFSRFLILIYLHMLPACLTLVSIFKTLGTKSSSYSWFILLESAACSNLDEWFPCPTAQCHPILYNLPSPASEKFPFLWSKITCLLNLLSPSFLAFFFLLSF